MAFVQLEVYLSVTVYAKSLLIYWFYDELAKW